MARCLISLGGWMPRHKHDAAASLRGRVLFVYYKINEADRASVLLVVQAFEKKIAQQFPLLSLELMQRPASSAGMETWMEIYRQQDGLSDQTLRGIEELARGLGMPQPRLNEVFVALRRDDLPAGQ